jgi:hypothetical protein
MKNWDPAITAAIEAEAADIVFLLEIDFLTGTQYFTEADIPVVYADNRYLPAPMNLGSPQFASDLSVDSFTIDVDNTDLWFSALLMGNDAAGREIRLTFAALDADYQILAVEPLFRGYIDDWDISEVSAQLTAASEMTFWKKKSLRKCQASCRWPFRSTECGYAGTQADCNQTWTRCRELGNTGRFGGFRFLPSIQTQEIWWGRQPG